MPRGVKGTAETFICLNCGSENKKKHQNRNMFCSNECRGKHQQKQWFEENRVAELDTPAAEKLEQMRLRVLDMQAEMENEDESL